MQIGVFFKKTKVILLKSIYIHFKMLSKQILVLFRARKRNNINSSKVKEKNNFGSSQRRCSIKKLFLKISQYSHENTLFLINLQAWNLQLYLKETLTQAFYCAYYKIYKNIYFEKHLWTTASVICQKSSVDIRVRF